MTQVTQADINKAAWGACDTFRGVVDPSVYKDFVLTLLFLKYVSDVWKDHHDKYTAEHPDSPELVAAMMQQEAFVLPPGASFDALHKRRHEAGNGERIDKALHAIEEANGEKLRDVFQDISFNSNKLGDEQQKNDILRHLLEDFSKPQLDLRPSRVGQLDIIGGAYEYLISRFAAGAGKEVVAEIRTSC
jgi:type I restriction enzyme M protein